MVGEWPREENLNLREELIFIKMGELKKYSAGLCVLEEECPILKKVAGNGEIKIIYHEWGEEEKGTYGKRVTDIACPYYYSLLRSCKASPVEGKDCSFRNI